MSAKWAIVLSIEVLVLSIGIGGGSHFDSDDTLYTEMARELVETGNLSDNQWSGVVQFEKPPLLIWSLAASGAVFGFGEGPMRAPVVLFAIVALIALYALARGLGLDESAALTATGLLCGSYFFVLMSRRIMTDIPLLAMALSAAAFLVQRRVAAFGVCVGLAVMAKGPAAAPLVLALVVFGLWQRTLTGRQWGKAVAWGLLIALPWHLVQTWRHGAAFWDGYVGYHVGARATSHVVPGLSLSQLFEVLLRERLLLLGGVLGFLGLAWRRFSDPVGRFGLLWTGFSLLPVVLSTTRLPHYLTPIVPGLALMAVGAVPHALWRRRLAPMVAGVAVVVAFLAAPEKLVMALDPDFGPDSKVMGQIILNAAAPEDLVATYNVTSNAITFYGGGHRVLLTTDDERFFKIQEAVLLIRRAGVLRRLGSRGFPKPATPGARRFVVARASDQRRLLARMAGPAPLFVQRSRDGAGGWILVNDAGIGSPISPLPFAPHRGPETP